MCRACWEDEGSPAIQNENTRRLCCLIDEVLAVFPNGGPLHAVLDDMNVGDSHIRYAMRYIDSAHKGENEWSLYSDHLGLARRTAERLLECSYEERMSAIALYEGWAA